jgi:hypothetical protein
VRWALSGVRLDLFWTFHYEDPYQRNLKRAPIPNRATWLIIEHYTKFKFSTFQPPPSDYDKNLN